MVILAEFSLIMPVAGAEQMRVCSDFSHLEGAAQEYRSGRRDGDNPLKMGGNCFGKLLSGYEFVPSVGYSFVLHFVSTMELRRLTRSILLDNCCRSQAVERVIDVPPLSKVLRRSI